MLGLRLLHNKSNNLNDYSNPEMKINFKVLSTFLAVAENASFSKAAEQTHLSLPAVSMQVKQLEERLGVALFQRTTRKVELTREGEALMISTRKAIAELDSSLARIQMAAKAQQGHLSFACVPTVAGSACPDCWWNSRGAIPASRFGCVNSRNLNCWRRCDDVTLTSESAPCLIDSASWKLNRFSMIPMSRWCRVTIRQPAGRASPCARWPNCRC